MFNFKNISEEDWNKVKNFVYGFCREYEKEMAMLINAARNSTSDRSSNNTFIVRIAESRVFVVNYHEKTDLFEVRCYIIPIKDEKTDKEDVLAYLNENVINYIDTGSEAPPEFIIDYDFNQKKVLDFVYRHLIDGDTKPVKEHYRSLVMERLKDIDNQTLIQKNAIEQGKKVILIERLSDLQLCFMIIEPFQGRKTILNITGIMLMVEKSEIPDKELVVKYKKEIEAAVKDNQIFYEFTFDTTEGQFLSERFPIMEHYTGEKSVLN